MATPEQNLPGARRMPNDATRVSTNRRRRSTADELADAIGALFGPPDAPMVPGRHRVRRRQKRRTMPHGTQPRGRGIERRMEQVPMRDRRAKRGMAPPDGSARDIRPMDETPAEDRRAKRRVPARVRRPPQRRR